MSIDSQYISKEYERLCKKHGIKPYKKNRFTAKELNNLKEKKNNHRGTHKLFFSTKFEV